MPCLSTPFLIPAAAPLPADWGALPIVECGEPLVSLRESARLHLQPVYAELALSGASTAMLLRQGVVERLEQALSFLPKSLGLLVLDGFRSLEVQKALWDWQWQEVKRDYPHLTHAEIHEKVREFVAEPNSDPARPTPHRTGGAVDLTLFELTHSEALPMGTAFDEATEATQSDWFERHPQEPFTQNRRLLFSAMTRAGFVNYPSEWWHFEYGTRRWAASLGMNNAVYGSAE